MSGVAELRWFQPWCPTAQDYQPPVLQYRVNGSQWRDIPVVDETPEEWAARQVIINVHTEVEDGEDSS